MTEPLIDWPLLGRFSRNRRSYRNLGLRKAAKQIGVSPATLSRMERGGAMNADDFVRLCRWLEIPVELSLGEQARD